jgi:uncharacterized membrane protein
MTLARNFFNKAEQQLIIDAIANAELKTSGEIRVHIENFCFGNELKRAEKIFTKLKMHQTTEQNGVLIYIATFSKKIAVAGDKGIHQKVSSQFWTMLVDNLISKFKADKKAEALAECIVECGIQLGNYFPLKSDDKNELSNNISF